MKMRPLHPFLLFNCITFLANDLNTETSTKNESMEDTEAKDESSAQKDNKMVNKGEAWTRNNNGI